MKDLAFTTPRTELRIGVDLPVRLRFGWKWSEEIGAEATDISGRGMRVQCHAPLRLGLDVEAVFASEPDGARRYRVVWVRDLISRPNRFDIGFQLVGESPAEGTSPV